MLGPALGVPVQRRQARPEEVQESSLGRVQGGHSERAGAPGRAKQQLQRLSVVGVRRLGCRLDRVLVPVQG